MHAATPASVADTHVHRLYGEYAGLPVGVVTQCVQHSATFNQISWQECAGATFADKANTYYEQHEECLFDLLHRRSSRTTRRAELVKHGHWARLAKGGATVLDFGGGLGLTASLLQEAGKTVTYCDVDGPTARFAAWYFERSGQPDIEVLLTPSAATVLPAERQWDLVLVDDVLGHLPDPVATVERLASAVTKGGLLYLVDGQSEASPAQPMCRPVALADLLAGAPTLRAMQRVPHGDDGCWVFRRR